MLGTLILKSELNLPFFNPNIARGLVGFFTGCIVYKLNEIFTQKRKENQYFPLYFFIVTAVIAIIIDLHINYSIFHIDRYQSSPVMIYPLIIMMVLNIDILNKLMSLKPLVFIGSISYSIYIIHFPIQILIDTAAKYFGFTTHSYYVFFLYIATTIITSIFSYRYIDEPLKVFVREKFVIS